MKRALAILLSLVLLLGCLSGCTFLSDFFGALNNNSLKNVSSAIFTLDVNPGVRIFVDEANIVLGVEGTNDDGSAILAGLSLVGKDYQKVVGLLIDKLKVEGYLEDGEASVLISIEKEDIAISEALSEKLNEAFQKHGVTPAIIAQKLQELDAEIADTIHLLSRKHHISEGKARLVEMLVNEFPELAEGDLAKLSIRDLAILLQDLSEESKDSFTHHGKHEHHGSYLSRAQAFHKALESLTLPEGTVIEPIEIRATRQEGKTVYVVKFIYDALLYTFTVDAASGEILSSGSKESTEFDTDAIIDSFCTRNNIPGGEMLHHILGQLMGGLHHGDAPLSRGMLLNTVLGVLNLSQTNLKRTDVEVHTGESGTVCSVTLELKNGDVYNLVVEAYTGIIMQGTFNGEDLWFFVQFQPQNGNEQNHKHHNENHQK